jgi:hypothetical protein
MRKRSGGDAISYQVSVRGRGISRLSQAAMRELLDRYVSGFAMPEGVEVAIQCWREGRELDMHAENPRAQVLRDTFRRFLQAGRVKLETRDAEDGE